MIIKVYDGYESQYKGAEVDAAIGRAQKAISLDDNNVFTGSNEFQGTVILGSQATVSTPDTTDDSEKVASTAFVKAQGYITAIVSTDVIEALGYTPEDATNKVTFIDSDSTDTQYPSAKAVYNVTNNNSVAINTINSKIPSAATSTNQLADKDFVNSSIATSTATFRGTFNSLADLEAYSGPKDDNDYAFVVTVDSAGNTLYNRYKYTGSAWLFEYSLNNSSFTSVQWAAVNSGANATNIGQIATNTSLIGDLQTDKQDVIQDLATIRAGATAGLTAIQPNDNITKLNNNAGYITSVSSSDITSALGYTPYSSSNPSGYISSITSSDVTSALGYTPYSSANPSGFISSASVSILTDVTLSNVSNGQALLYNSTSGKWENSTISTGATSWGNILGTLANQTDLQNALNEKTTMAAVEAKGYITGINSSMITTALGYTPYDGTTNPNGYIIGISSSDVTTALGYTPYNASNPSGYITSTAIANMQTTTNLVTTISSVSTDSTYPSAKCVYDAIQAGGGGATSLDGLSDVDITNPAQGENLTYDATLGKWKNTLSSATVAWGGITGTLADQTDLQNELNKKTTKFTTVNPALTSSSNICTWNIANEIGSKEVQVSIYEVSTSKEVVADITATTSTISIELVSNSNIATNTYEAVIIG